MSATEREQQLEQATVEIAGLANQIIEVAQGHDSGIVVAALGVSLTRLFKSMDQTRTHTYVSAFSKSLFASVGYPEQ